MVSVGGKFCIDKYEASTEEIDKKGKTLSEAHNIMAGMCRDAHIDPHLFGLFIEAGIAQQYAERYLQPEQIDTPDHAALLARAGLA